MNLSEFLASAEPKLAATISAFADSAAEISEKIRTVETGKAGTKNDFGEEQLALDVLADEIIFENLKKSGVVATASSEEQASEVAISESGEFTVAFDPLDGSSLVDVNLAVGTIFGIWSGKNLVGQIGRDLAAAGFAVYGPRTTLVFTIANSVPTEFTLQKNGEWLQTKAELKIGEGKMFAPGNLRATSELDGYKKLVDFWCEQKYTLRYSGGMVPDVNQILLKEKGVFSYPGSVSAPAKLRLAYECAPLAAVVEAAGGASSDGERSVLDKKIAACDDRTVVCLGSKNEVARFEEFLAS